MSQTSMLREIRAAAVCCFVLTFFSVTLAAQSVDIQGIIKGRNGPAMLVQTSDASEIEILLDDSTDVGQLEGMLKARHKSMSMAALIPGLAVKIKASPNADNKLVAETVRFKGNDLQRAKAMQAGMHETKEQVEANRLAAEANKQKIQTQQAELARQNAEIQKQQAAISEAVARFGQLDDYYIFDEVTVYFENGKTEIESQYVPKLQAMAQKAGGIEGYMIEVRGYASVSGSVQLNQRLSSERASNVSSILLQQCKVPLTRILAPGAMGESEQVGAEPNTKEGEAQNRRVVVRVLQNKAIAAKAITVAQE